MKLNQFLNDGIQNITETAARFYLNNKEGRKFMLRMISEFHKDARVRDAYESGGTHIPPFLIASISAECNLRCAGCYARANGSCGSGAEDEQMPASDWHRLFQEATDLGISFILLAGGEPLLRRDVIEAAAGFGDILFPVFTNGTLIDEEYLQFFTEHRNLIPVLSIEGGATQTDSRRGQGVSDMVTAAANRLRENGVLYGVSITVTTENQTEITGAEYVAALKDIGCGIVFYVEYVPVEPGTEHLMLSDNDMKDLQIRVEALKADKSNKGMILLSFPGDEDAMGGCLAAGRGFFHINPTGGAEPCPFSPFSAFNLKDHSLLDALKSPFFEKVREISAAQALNHKGGCTLFQFENEVMSLL